MWCSATTWKLSLRAAARMNPRGIALVPEEAIVILLRVHLVVAEGELPPLPSGVLDDRYPLPFPYLLRIRDQPVIAERSTGIPSSADWELTASTA